MCATHRDPANPAEPPSTDIGEFGVADVSGVVEQEAVPRVKQEPREMNARIAVSVGHETCFVNLQKHLYHKLMGSSVQYVFD